MIEKDELSAIFDEFLTSLTMVLMTSDLGSPYKNTFKLLSKSQKLFEMFLLNWKFEIATKNKFWVYINHWLSKYKPCGTPLVTLRAYPQ